MLLPPRLHFPTSSGAGGNILTLLTLVASFAASLAHPTSNIAQNLVGDLVDGFHTHDGLDPHPVSDLHPGFHSHDGLSAHPVNKVHEERPVDALGRRFGFAQGVDYEEYGLWEDEDGMEYGEERSGRSWPQVWLRPGCGLRGVWSLGRRGWNGIRGGKEWTLLAAGLASPRVWTTRSMVSGKTRMEWNTGRNGVDRTAPLTTLSSKASGRGRRRVLSSRSSRQVRGDPRSQQELPKPQQERLLLQAKFSARRSQKQGQPKLWSKSKLNREGP